MPANLLIPGDPPIIGEDGLRRNVGRRVKDRSVREGFLSSRYYISTESGKVISRVYEGSELSIEVNHPSKPYFRRYQVHFNIETDGVFM